MPKEIKTFSICEDANGDNARTIFVDTDCDSELYFDKTILTILNGEHISPIGIKTASMFSSLSAYMIPCHKRNFNGSAMRKELAKASSPTMGQKHNKRIH